MALTVNSAFTQFRRDFVDLNEDEVKTARSSRDFLIDQIHKLPEGDSSFPWLTGARILFGSFARRTKIQPLDDIDLMIVMYGAGGTEINTIFDGYTCRVAPGSMETPVRSLCDESGYINSTRVLFKFKNALSGLHHYQLADLHKRYEAVTLEPKSYPWHFDIVPAFGVRTDSDSTDYYVIPDGKGHWKRTDPRRDDLRITAINKQHNGLVIPIIRLLKYWNHYHNLKMMSYWLESMALSIFEEMEPLKDIELGLLHFFVKAIKRMEQPCPDPKGLGPNLDDDVDPKMRQNITNTLLETATHILKAIEYETASESPQDAILEWREVFGDSFPTYG